MTHEPALAGTSTITSRLLLRVVDQRGGERAVARVLERAQLASRRTQLESVRGRITYAEKLRRGFGWRAAGTGSSAAAGDPHG